MEVASLLGIDIDAHILIEALLVATIFYLLLQKSYKPEKPLSEEEINQLCNDWVPEPLHPALSEAASRQPPVLSSAPGARVIANGAEVVNLSTLDFLGVTSNDQVLAASRAAIDKYGCGACGPRGFYGTIDVHLDLEKKIVEFTGAEEAIIYSFGLATPASTIPAFAKKGDILICDEAVNYAIQNGLTLSRSTVRWFKHNDMADLERQLQRVIDNDIKHPKALNRRFIVVEGIYQNRGDLAPLASIVALKENYKFRVMVDESYSFGVLGPTGRGATEHWGIPVGKVDVITASMGMALGSMGGFCCGSTKIVSHQRLNGAGYVFSAALPPYLASASMEALNFIERSPEQLVQLRKNAEFLQRALARVTGLTLVGAEFSPIMHLHLIKSTGSIEVDNALLDKICDKVLGKGVLLTRSKYTHLEKFKQEPSIRLTVCATHTEEDLLSAATAIKALAKMVLGNGHSLR
eukprot:jgi/Chlat1/6065/Chrsp4S06339